MFAGLVVWAEKNERPLRDIDTPDIMPTLLGLCGETDRIPAAVEGRNLAGVVRGMERPDLDYAPILTCPAPFGQ